MFRTFCVCVKLDGFGRGNIGSKLIKTARWKNGANTWEVGRG